MKLILLLILVGLLLSGCSAFKSSYHLEPNEVGYATKCFWFYNHPFWCVEDPNRSTVDDQMLKHLMDELENAHVKEYRKRAI